MSTFDEVTQNMTAELASAVIQVGIDNGAYEGSIPADDAQKIADGRELCRIAKTAFDQGVRSKAALGILGAAGIVTDGEAAPAQQPPAAPPADGGDQTLYNHGTGETQAFPAAAVGPMLQSGWSTEPPPQPDPTPPPAADPQGFDINALIPGYGDKSAKEIVEAMKGLASQEQVDAVKKYEADQGEDRKTIRNFAWEAPATPAQQPGGEVQILAAPDEAFASTEGMIEAYHQGDLGHGVANRERLGPPQEVEGEDPVMPMDLSELGDGQLSELHTRFHARDVRATYLLGIEEALAMAARRISESVWGGAFDEIYAQEKGELGENPSASALDSARSNAKLKAEHSRDVVSWRNRMVRHEIEVRGLAGRQKGYEKHVARLSREQSRREAQRQGAGG